jgi:hypothetical protein
LIVKLRTALSAVSVAALAVVSSVAQAAPAAAVDVTDITGTLTNQITPIGLVMAAGLTLAAIVVGYKWIRRATS